MTDQELIKLKVDDLTDEEARIIGMDLLKEDIDVDKASVKRSGLIAAVITAGMVAVGMDNIPGYALMGIDSMFVYNFFNTLSALRKKKKQLKAFEGNYYEDDYRHFLKECQKYVKEKRKLLGLQDQEEHTKNR